MKIAFLFRGQIRNYKSSSRLFAEFIKTLPLGAEYKCFGHAYESDCLGLESNDFNLTAPISDVGTRADYYPLEVFQSDDLTGLYNDAYSIISTYTNEILSSQHQPIASLIGDPDVVSVFRIGNFIAQYQSAARVYDLYQRSDYQADIVVSLRWDAALELQLPENLDDDVIFSPRITIYRGIGHIIDHALVMNPQSARIYFRCLENNMRQILSDPMLCYFLSTIQPSNYQHHMWTLLGRSHRFLPLDDFHTALIRAEYEGPMDIVKIQQQFEDWPQRGLERIQTLRNQNLLREPWEIVESIISQIIVRRQIIGS